MMNNSTERRKPKVFIVNRGCHNFSAATNYGELVFMTHGVINRYSASEIYRVFEECLADSTPDDYLLVSGMSTMLVVASGILVYGLFAFVENFRSGLWKRRFPESGFGISD